MDFVLESADDKDFTSRFEWCGRRELNSHTRRALPPQGSVSTIPPRPQKVRTRVSGSRETKNS